MIKPLPTDGCETSGSPHGVGGASAHAIEVERELSHRVKNMFAVINAIVSITGRVKGIPAEAAEINARIQALGRAYETTFEGSHLGSFDLGNAIAAVLRPYADAPERLKLSGEEIRVPSATISLVGMVLHELAVNAKQHGAWSAETGSIAVSWKLGCKDLECDARDKDTCELSLSWRETGGAAQCEQAVEAGGGTQIVDRLLSTSRGAIYREWSENGLIADICIPAAKVS